MKTKRKVPKRKKERRTIIIDISPASSYHEDCGTGSLIDLIEGVGYNTGIKVISIN